jgi:hypothetical protein
MQTRLSRDGLHERERDSFIGPCIPVYESPQENISVES